MSKKAILILFTLIFLLVACQPGTDPTSPQTLTVITHDSFSVSSELVTQFEEANNAKLVFIQGGDTGSVLNRLILTSVNNDLPEADVFYGLDNTFLSRALEQTL